MLPSRHDRTKGPAPFRPFASGDRLRHAIAGTNSPSARIAAPLAAAAGGLARAISPCA